MFRKSQLLSIIIAIAVISSGVIFWNSRRIYIPPPRDERGEIPFIPSEFYKEEREGKAVILGKMPLEACVEMVMHYWGTPPTPEESRLLLSQNWEEPNNVFKILRRHRLSFLYLASLDEETIRKILRLRIPIIAACNERSFYISISSYHTWLLLKELEDGRLIFNDPETKADIEMDADLFINAYWLITNNCSLLIFPPSKKKLLKDIIPLSCFEEQKDLMSLEKIKPSEKNYKERIIKQLRMMVKKKPNSPTLNYILGLHLSREGDPEGLLWLKKAYELKPYPFYQAEYAIAHCYLHKNKEALQLLRNFINQNPKYIALPSVFFHLCYLLAREGKEEEIRQLFQKASAIAPPHLLASLVEIYYQTLPTYEEKENLLRGFFTKYPWAKKLKGMGDNLFYMFLLEGKYKGAEEILQKAKEEGMPMMDEWFMLTRAIKYISQKKYGEAEEIYNKIGEENRWFKVMLAEKMGKWKEVKEELEVLIKSSIPQENDYFWKRAWLNSNRLYYLPGYIDACLHLHDYKDAKIAIEDFLNIYETSVVLGYDRYACYAYAMGGMICYWEGEEEKAKEWLAKAYHNPYFKGLDTNLIRDVKKTLKELEKTKN